MAAASWTSKTGQKFDFQAHPITANWNDAAGIYMFASQDSSGNWTVYYVGQTDSFKNRLPTHERWAEAVRSGATTVLACTVTVQTMRDLVEKELCQQLQPNLNTHHVGKIR